MALEPSSTLANVLEGLDYHWTNTNEDGLNAMGQSWVSFSGKPQTHVATADSHAQRVFANNSGQGVDAMNAAWSQPDAAHKNFTVGGNGAAPIGGGLSICAAVVLMLKASVIVLLVQLVIEIFSAIAEAFETCDASLAEIPVFKELTQKAIGLIQNTAVNTVMASA